VGKQALIWRVTPIDVVVTSKAEGHKGSRSIFVVGQAVMWSRLSPRPYPGYIWDPGGCI